MSLLPLFLLPSSLQIWSLTWQKKRTTSFALHAPRFLLTSSLCSTIQVQFSYANILQGCSSFIYGILPTGRISGDLCYMGSSSLCKAAGWEYGASAGWHQGDEAEGGHRDSSTTQPRRLKNKEQSNNYKQWLKWMVLSAGSVFKSNYTLKSKDSNNKFFWQRVIYPISKNLLTVLLRRGAGNPLPKSLPTSRNLF